ncbi:MAG: hypothetical protein P8X89_14225 [Reinekea sp.]
MLLKNWGEPMVAPAIFEKQIEIKLFHSASTEGVTVSGFIYLLPESVNPDWIQWIPNRYILVTGHRPPVF